MNRFALFLAAAAPALAQDAAPGDLHTGPFGKNGTWNLYQLVRESVTWTEAHQAASAMPDPTGTTDAKGHLVSLHSLAEHLFVYRRATVPQVWIGLTDNERYGGKEAYSRPDRGWVWTSGEPVTFRFWGRSQPDDWLNEGTGEDCGHLELSSWWFDAGNGVDGQRPRTLYYLVEWETQSEKPVPGAKPLRALWPKRFDTGAPVPGKWSIHLAKGIVEGDGGEQRRPRSLHEAVPILEAAFEGDGGNEDELTIIDKSSFPLNSPLFHLTAGADRTAQGLFPYHAAPRANFSNQQGPFVASVSGKIQVSEAGRYTFALACESAVALRIGGKPWIAAHGIGTIDPLDKTVLTQPNGGMNTTMRGVIDLHAGDHLVEALWFVGKPGAELQVSSAKGEFAREGDTDAWRRLGHTARGDVSWPGVDQDGWTVECTKSNGHAVANAKPWSLRDGLIALSLGKNHLVQKSVRAVNFSETGSEHFTRYPGVARFPNDVKGSSEDHFATRARANLVVPADGTYWIGFHADNLGALRIKGHEWQRIVQSAQGQAVASLNGDTISLGPGIRRFDGRLVGGITLKKGTYEIEALHVDIAGGASFAVFGAPAGYPPRLLKKDGAEITEDHDGLLLVPAQ